MSKLIEVPDTAFVECPKSGKFRKHRRVTQCFNDGEPGKVCEYYKGLAPRGEAAETTPFPGRYLVLCACPRPLAMIEADLTENVIYASPK